MSALYYNTKFFPIIWFGLVVSKLFENFKKAKQRLRLSLWGAGIAWTKAAWKSTPMASWIWPSFCTYCDRLASVHLSCTSGIATLCSTWPLTRIVWLADAIRLALIKWIRSISMWLPIKSMCCVTMKSTGLWSRIAYSSAWALLNECRSYFQFLANFLVKFVIITFILIKPAYNIWILDSLFTLWQMWTVELV